MLRLKNETESHVCIEISGRITSANAEEMHAAAAQLRKEHPQGSLILHLEKLEYISSAGLRVILMLQKNEKSRIALKRVTPEVEDVLVKTGFTRIFRVENESVHVKSDSEKKMESICTGHIENPDSIPAKELAEIEKLIREISADSYEVIARGTTGAICRLNGEDLVKIYNKGTSLGRVFRELMLSKRALIHGLPTAISYEIIRVRDCYGTIFEKIDGCTLADAIHREPEKAGYYAGEYASLLHQIHTTHVNEGVFPSAKKVYLTALDRCAHYYTAEETGIMRKLLEKIPDRDTLLHRDYHPKNIMVSDGRLMLIDMADISTGHPVFDWMGIMATHQFFPQIFPEAVRSNTGMTAEDCTMLRNSLFRLYFADRSPDETATIMRQAELYSKIHLGVSPALRAEQAEEINSICVNKARENLPADTATADMNIFW